MTLRRRHRLLLLGVLTALVLALLGLDLWSRVRRAGHSLGIYLEETPGGLEIRGVAADSPAERAGLRPGDRLIWIGGRTVKSLAAYDEAALTFERGHPTRLEAMRAGGLLSLQVVPGTKLGWPSQITKALACLCYLALMAVALIQFPADPRARLLIALAGAIAVELALPLDVLGIPLVGQITLPVLSLLVGFQMGAELHLAASIPHQPGWLRSRPWLLPVVYSVALGLGILEALALVGEAAGTGFPPWTVAQAELLLWDLGVPLWALGVVVLLAVPAWRWPQPLGRQQAGLVLLGVIPWAALVTGLTVGGWLGREPPGWVELAEPVVLLIYPLAVFAAIFRYQLFDLEVVVRRSMVYTSLTGVLVLLFYAAIGAGGALLSERLPGGRRSVWVVAAATLIMGLLFRPLRLAIHRLIDRQFFPERAALRRHLIKLASELPATGSLPAMGEELVGKLCAIFGLESVALLLSGRSGILTPLASKGIPRRLDEVLLLSRLDPGIDLLHRTGRPLPAEILIARSPALRQRFELFRTAVLVPLVSEEELVGVLVLGRKIDGRPFPAEEIELLNTLAGHVATAFGYAQLFESATRDALTGLLRRESILEQLDHELRRAQRFDRPLTIGLADLDRFREINDRHGRLKGDLILKRVARTVAETLRGTDIIGRYGGEEFLFVLPETSMSGAFKVAEKVLRQVEEVGVESGSTARVTMSIGLAESVPDAVGRRADATELIAEADRALESAKRGGRSRVGSRRALG